MNRISCLLFSIILVGVFAPIGRSQAGPRLEVSIKIDSSIFQRGRPVLVHAKIKWGRVTNAEAKTFQAVLFQLTKPGTKPRFRTRGDCLVATFSLPNQLTPKDGEIIEFDVALDELYWNDIISSLYDFSRPKNMFDVIPVGAYSLSMSTSFDANYSTKRDPRVIEIASNSILVEMR